eukprot:9281845-Pyramimonas_sp.AAC.1
MFSECPSLEAVLGAIPQFGLRQRRPSQPSCGVRASFRRECPAFLPPHLLAPFYLLPFPPCVSRAGQCFGAL